MGGQFKSIAANLLGTASPTGVFINSFKLAVRSIKLKLIRSLCDLSRRINLCVEPVLRLSIPMLEFFVSFA